jgi:hypothetical protein
MSVPILGQDQKKSDEPQIRLLYCRTCGSIEELPDFDGPPQYDDLLNISVERHRFPSGDEHIGSLFKVDIRVWAQYEARRKIIEQIKGGASKGLGEIDEAFYDTKSQFAEDALKCYQQHMRPKGQCPDYMSDSKVLLPNTKADRKELGLTDISKVGGPKTKLCQFCVTGDTEVVTREGIFGIKELSGKAPELLVPVQGMGRIGKFQNNEVHYFGEQPTFEVSLRRGKARKTLRTTAEHRWFLRDGKELTTADLQEGDTLQGIEAVGFSGKSSVMRIAVAQGFVYGDGYVGHDDRRPAQVTFYNEKDLALMDYFQGFEVTTVSANGQDNLPYIYGMPRSWKSLPSLEESRTFLLSWLAGYFAADGTVDKSGAASISSANRSSLEFVRSVAAVCGVRYGPITHKVREGFPGRTPSSLYTMSLRSTDLPEWFWIIEQHRGRVPATAGKPHYDWSVVSVIATGEVEPVYCAVVPESGAFALSDGLLTGNCPVHAYNVRKAREQQGVI